MANTFLGSLTATTVPASDTVVPVVRNGETSAEKSTLANLAKGFAAVGKVAVTQPATASTLVIADGQTLTCNASVTLGTMAANATPFSIDLKNLPFFTGLTLTISGANSNATVIYE